LQRPTIQVERNGAASTTAAPSGRFPQERRNATMRKHAELCLTKLKVERDRAKQRRKTSSSG